MRRRILYVEDDPTGREVAVYNLQKAGYDVTPASEGQEALSRFSLEKFDLVITDIRMPGLSGLELVRRIHRMVPCLPVIVVTAFGGMETAVEAMKGGACYFISKPFDRTHLQLAVEKVLGGRFLTDEAEALQVPVSEVERGIVCVFPNRGGSLLLRSDRSAPESAPSQAEEKKEEYSSAD